MGQEEETLNNNTKKIIKKCKKNKLMTTNTKIDTNPRENAKIRKNVTLSQKLMFLFLLGLHD